MTSTSPTPRLGGIPMKYLSLVSLTLQNSLLTILLHYSRTAPDNKVYSAPVAVLLSEILKSIISFSIALFNSTRSSLQPRLPGSPPHPADPATYHDRLKSETYHHSYRPLPSTQSSTTTSPPLSSIILTQIKLNLSAIFSRDCWKLSIPAILYVIQNNLQFIAASHLDVATFSVTYQLKILTTALCSVLILKRRLSVTKWISLLFLAIGVALVQLQNVSSSTNTSSSPESSDPEQPKMNRTLGFMAVSLACFTSGLAGVYFELVLKSSTKVDLWIRNVQLSLFSLLPALFTALAASSSSPEPMFAHFGFWAWATILTQVFGGLVTALVIKFADNILKGFATSLSIILSTVAGVFLFDAPLPFGSALGASVVLMSTYCYNLSSGDSSSPVPSLANDKPIGLPSPPAVVIDFSHQLSSRYDEKNDADDYNGEDVHLLPDSTKICPSPKSSHFPLTLSSSSTTSSTSSLSPHSPTHQEGFHVVNNSSNASQLPPYSHKK
ncbi:hypothetical protein PGT21_032006 [Puccinia graminis f. sp. tritici]|uniref:UDP-galactose transporter n=1 Tax=Puccinia graminis f. sp. tritici TaxID=56615 RepID=A0A5B0R5S7_PUCGR|nr:hypothetical protein PGT21_032006 [Puccinia graminis f. sp. tritici]KAA1120613.1 hypothetical protein PGTUg99_010013 [Puccinia graminis f. sp. tritici]